MYLTGDDAEAEDETDGGASGSSSSSSSSAVASKPTTTSAPMAETVITNIELCDGVAVNNDSSSGSASSSSSSSSSSSKIPSSAIGAASSFDEKTGGWGVGYGVRARVGRVVCFKGNLRHGVAPARMFQDVEEQVDSSGSASGKK